MAKITLIVCDVKPCNRIADRNFQINGHTIHVCGEGCYVKYWSREYQAWKQDPYELQASHNVAQEKQHSARGLQLLASKS